MTAVIEQLLKVSRPAYNTGKQADLPSWAEVGTSTNMLDCSDSRLADFQSHTSICRWGILPAGRSKRKRSDSRYPISI